MTATAHVLMAVIKAVFGKSTSTAPKIAPEKIKMDGGAGSPPPRLPINTFVGPKPVAPVGTTKSLSPVSPVKLNIRG